MESNQRSPGRDDRHSAPLIERDADDNDIFFEHRWTKRRFVNARSFAVLPSRTQPLSMRRSRARGRQSPPGREFAGDGRDCRRSCAGRRTCTAYQISRAGMAGNRSALHGGEFAGSVRGCYRSCTRSPSVAFGDSSLPEGASGRAVCESTPHYRSCSVDPNALVNGVSLGDGCTF